MAQLPDIGTSSEDADVAPATSTAEEPAPDTTGQDADGTGEPAPGAGQPQGESALSLVDDAALRKVAFNETEEVPSSRPAATALVADLPLYVEVPKDADGKLRVYFIAAADGAREPLRRNVEISEDHAIPYVEGPVGRGESRSIRFSVLGGSSTLLALRLAMPATADFGLADGLLRVLHSDPAVKPLVLRVQGAGPEVRFDPATPKLRVTRGLGFKPCCLVRDEADIQVLGPGADALAAMGEVRTRLTSARNGELLGTLRFEEDRSRGQFDATFDVDEVNMTGKYEGGVPLDPRGTETVSLPVVVEVQDAFYIPAIWLAVFAFLGGYLVNWWNQDRRRRILRSSLKDAVERYSKAPRSGVTIYDLGLKDAKFFDQRETRTRDESWSTVVKLYWDIGEAKSDEEFAEHGQEVAEIVADVDRWFRIRRELQYLRTEVDKSGLPRGDIALEESRDLLDIGAADGPGSGEHTDTYLQQVADQQRILRRYTQLVRAWKSLKGWQKALVPDCEPPKVYAGPGAELSTAEEPPGAARSADERRALLIRLNLARGDVRRASQLTQPPDEAPATDELANLSATDKAWLAGITEGREVRYIAARAQLEQVLRQPSVVGRGRQEGSQRPAQPPARSDTRSSRDLLAGVKKWDFVLAAATSVVALIAYLLPKYATHTFGSWEDYLGLATLGFLGSATVGGLVLNWQLFPELRPYTVASVAAKADPPNGGPPSGGAPTGDPPVEEGEPDPADEEKVADGETSDRPAPGQNDADK